MLAAGHFVSRHYIADAGDPASQDGRPARDIAQEYLKRAAGSLGLSENDLAAVYVAKEYRTAHNGVTHIVYKQRFQDVEVQDAEWVVNIDGDGRVLNAGGRLYSAPQNQQAPSVNEAPRAAKSAVAAVDEKASKRFEAAADGRPLRRNGVRFARGPLAEEVEGEPVWTDVHGELRAGWRFYVAHSDQVHRYSVVVANGDQAVASKTPLTFFQSAPQGLVFEKGSPQPNPTPGIRLTSAPLMVDRTWQPFTGDKAASPRGWTDGFETAGNNVIAGENLSGAQFVQPPATAKGTNGSFIFPLQLGPGAPNPLSFADAATTNLFYWMNRAHDLHYLSGFDEAAGNFQQDNFGRGGVGGDPIYAYSHFGSQAVGKGQIENAFFSLRGVEGDGGQPEVSMFVSQAVGANGDVFTDGSYDAYVMVHEYTHGVSTRLARQVYQTFQGASMGEAWSDFYGLEYTLPDNAPPDGIYPAGEYFDQSWGYGGLRSRPFSTDMTVNPLTYANLGHVIPYGEVHADGEIWFAALWDARANLIAQFGDREGRRRVRLLVMDGMKLAPPQATMVDMRDAILLADRVDFKGTSQNQLWTAFAKRGLGALAWSDTGDTTHVISSTDLPSNTGQIRFYDNPLMIGEVLRLVVQDSTYKEPTMLVQLTSSDGDLENVVLNRTGSIYVGAISTSAANVTKQNGMLNIMPSDEISAYYVHRGADAQLITTTIETMPAYAVLSVRPSFTFANERQLSVGDGYTSVATPLPFEFRFFSQKYRSILVNGNGSLTFDVPVLVNCTDSTSLASINGIAPLWMNMTTGGSAQDNEGVFMSQTEKSVTFRWAAESISVFGPGTPINVASTLYDDGRVEFQYGEGNQNLQGAYTVRGCGVAPTVGMGNGHDAFAQAYILNSLSKFGLRLDPPYNFSSIPVANVDSPAADQHIQDILQVTGTASDETSGISRVDIIVDGIQRTRATYGIARPDACGAQKQTGCPNIGFSAVLNTAGLGLKPGPHALKVHVTNTRGAFSDFPVNAPLNFTIDTGSARQPYGALELPGDGDTVSGRLAVKGYALADDLRIVSVETLIDGFNFGAATYGATRSDICSALKTAPPNCPRVGFTASIGTLEAAPPVPDGAHQLQMRIRDETGRYTLIPANPVSIVVKNGAPAKIVGSLTTPSSNAQLTGTVTISGYAYSPGQRITSATLIVDGYSVARANYGLDRSDICSSLTDATACPNIGFAIAFDTRRVINGPHEIGIFLRNDRGDSILVPALVSNGINVFVNN